MRTETKRRLLSSAILTIVLVVGLSMIAFAGGDETEAAKPEMYATFWALVPPTVAIGLALITKEVYSSLFVGILVGAMFYSGFSFEGTMLHIFQGGLIAQLSDEYNVGILIFLVILGAMVCLMNKAGGSAAFGQWAGKHIKTRVGAQLATIALGVLIFIDDYFNCLTVGTVMKPLTDKYHISRAKLAYLIDATAAPVCIIAPVSSWAASVISSLPDEGEGGMATFLSTIPFNLYAILTIIMIVVVIAFKLDFGPMQKYELEAQMQKGDITDDATAQADDIGGLKVSAKGTLWDLLVPILALIIFCILSMLYTGGFFAGGLSLFEAFGNTNANLSLAMGGFGAIVVAAVLFLPRRILTFRSFMDGITAGIKSMVPACSILTLAWTLKGVCNALSVGPYVSDVVSSSSVPIAILPAIVFVVAAFLSFSTGTAWGTFGILIPIVVPICENVDISILSIMLAATLAGSVFGDHCSPISDTTILSSTGAGCDHITHVSTQIPYALLVAGCCFAGYIVAGLTRNVVITLVFSVALLIGALLVLHKLTLKRENAAAKAELGRRGEA